MNKAAPIGMSRSPDGLETVQSLYELMVSFRGARVVGRVRDRINESPTR